MNSTNNQTESETVCPAEDEINDTFWKFLIASVIITLGLSFIVRRKKCCRSCCWGRPGFLQPLNFTDEIGRRWAYAACFVILTHDIVLLFRGEPRFEFDRMPTNEEKWMTKYGWVSVFHKLFEAMCICLVFYPLLACIDHRHSIAANIVGILYLIPWIVIYTRFFVSCRMQKGFNGVALYLVRIPIYVALYVVEVSYVLDLVRNCIRIRNRRRKAAAAGKTLSTGVDIEKRGYKIGHHSEYVVKLLHRKGPEQDDETKYALRVKSRKLIKKAKYEKILGFCYSTRIVCCLTVSATLVFWMMIHAAEIYEEYILPINEFLCAIDDPSLQSIGEILCNDVLVTRMLLHIANVLAGLIVMGFLFNTLISYKRRWHQLLRGDHSWHMYGSTIVNPKNTLLNGLKFAGFQAAYAAWGYIVLMLVLSILIIFLEFALIIPLKNGEQNSLIKMLLRLWPTVLLGFIIALVQKLICRFCFLQDKGSVMALDNRRVYNAVSYYFLVLNVIVGFFSCMKRILIPFVLGVTFLSRLDRPLIMSGLETHDPGFASFVSMLLVDLYHNHPIVKSFVELLLKVREQPLLQQQELQNQHPAGEGEAIALQEAEQRLRSRMIRNRWLKTLTLVNNPCLAVKIIEQRLKEERRKAEDTIALLPVSPINPENESGTIEQLPSRCDNETTSTIQIREH